MAVRTQCTTMGHVTAGIQLSSEANEVVAAIDGGALAPRLDGIQGQMKMLAGQMTSFEVVSRATGSPGSTTRSENE